MAMLQDKPSSYSEANLTQGVSCITTADKRAYVGQAAKKKTRLQITRKINKLTHKPFPFGGELIKGQTDIRRIKSGNYSFLYTVIHRKVLVPVLNVSDRKNVYDYFNR